MKREDAIEVRRGHYREQAIEFGKVAVEAMLRDYKEPVREGTRRGDLIGLSLKKKRAASLMVLHNRYSGLGLKEIADLAGVSLGVLLVWRTEEEFRKEERGACRMLGEGIAGVIDNQVISELLEIKFRDKSLAAFLKDAKSKRESEGRKVGYLRIGTPEGEVDRRDLMSWLPFLNPSVSVPVIDLIAARVKSDFVPVSGEFAGLALLLMMREEVKDEKSLRRWRERPVIRDLTRAMVKSWIKNLSDPKVRKWLGPERFREEVENFKSFIFRELDL
jgi:hypothetical protein